MRVLAFMASLSFTPVLFAAIDIPSENKEKPKVETIAPFNAAALVSAINENKVDETLFFPAAAFQELKAIAKPLDYHKQLLSWYAADVKREHERLKKPVSLVSFKLGSCKWKEKGKEANAFPYLSCYKSQLKVEDAEKKAQTVELRTLINWGKTWYITHLGPIPKT